MTSPTPPHLERLDLPRHRRAGRGRRKLHTLFRLERLESRTLLSYTTTSYGLTTVIGGDNVADALVVAGFFQPDLGVVLSHTGDGNTQPNTPGAFNSDIDWDSNTPGDQRLIPDTNVLLQINLGGGAGVAHPVTVGSAAFPVSSLEGTAIAVNNPSSVSNTSLTLLDGGSTAQSTYTLDSGRQSGQLFSARETGNVLNGGILLQGSTGSASFTVNNTTPGEALSLVGSAANDSFQVAATGINSTLNLDGNGGSDSAFLSNASNVQSVLGAVNLSNPAGSTGLSVDDSADTVSRNVTISASSIVGLAPAAISYNQAELNNFFVNGGSGGNNFTILDTPSNTMFQVATVNTGEGNDTVAILNLATATPSAFVILDGGGGTDNVNVGNAGSLQGIQGSLSVFNVNSGSGANGLTNLTLDDAADPTSRSVSLTSTVFAPDEISYNVNGLTPKPIEYDIAQLSGLTINAGTGGNTATVDFNGQNPLPLGSPGFVYNGGTGGDTLTLQGGTGFQQETITASGPGAGTINLDGTFIGFTGLKPINDLAPASSFVFNVPTGPQSFAILDGPTLRQLATNQISSTGTPSGFELVNFANKTNVLVSASGNAAATNGQTITINAPIAASGLAALNVATGPGDDTVTVLADPAGIPTLISLGAGTNAISVASAGIVNSASTRVGGTGNSGSMTYDAAGNVVTVATGSVSTGSGNSLKSTVTFDNISQLRIINSPDPPLTATPRTITTILGTAFSDTTVASFVDTDPNGKSGDFTASINWGDGTTSLADSIAANGTGGFDIVGSHAYNTAGAFPVVVTINDLGSSFVSQNPMSGPFTVFTPGGASATAQSTAIVNGPTGVTATGLPVSAVEGRPFNGSVATFTPLLVGPISAAFTFTATIDWGDGTTPTAGTVTPPGNSGTAYVVDGTHTYGRFGTYTGHVSILFSGTLFGGADFTASVAPMNGPTGVTATGLPVSAVEGRPFNGSVATFTPLLVGPISAAFTFTATIDWGDGTTPTAGTVTPPGNSGTAYVVDGTHTYGRFGTYTGHVSILFSSTLLGGADFTASVAPDLTVYNTLDIDTTTLGSLRHALNEVNLGLGTTVTFAIPGTGVHTIALNQGLPDITRTVILDATTQPGFAGRPLVVLSGAGLAGNFNDGLVLVPGSEGSKIQGLTINGFSNVGIVVENAGGNTIRDNFLGTDATGTRAVPNFQGILIFGSSNNLIGGPGRGNLISGNSSAGLQILNSQTVNDPTVTFDQVGPASNNKVLGNKIGTNAAGTAAIPNNQGVFINDVPGNSIGGNGTGEGNLVSGNTSTAINVLGPNAANTVVLGNKIGTDVNGAGALGNGSGIFLFASAANPSSTDLTSGNTIQNNSAFGVRIRPLTDGPTVQSAVANPAPGGGYNQLTLTFTMYLNRTLASMTGNYFVTLIGRNGRLTLIPVTSATYNGINRTVVLQLGRTIPAGATFELRVIGTPPDGIADAAGNLLDGNETRARLATGTDNVTIFQQGRPSPPSASLAVRLQARSLKLMQRLHPKHHAHRRRH